MDERWQAESEEEGPDIQYGGLGYGGDHLWIAGVHISAYDYPGCLEDDEFDCDSCDFFIPETCPLGRNPYLIYDLRTIFSIYRERVAVSRWHKEELSRAICSELKAFGRPLHYTIVSQMLEDRYPTLSISEGRVLHTLAARSDLFEKVAEGVYRLRAASQH